MLRIYNGVCGIEKKHTAMPANRQTRAESQKQNFGGELEAQISRPNSILSRGTLHVANQKSDKYEEYTLYAEHCLAMARIAPDQQSRVVQREMAAEWLRLAGTAESERRDQISLATATTTPSPRPDVSSWPAGIIRVLCYRMDETDCPCPNCTSQRNCWKQSGAPLAMTQTYSGVGSAACPQRKPRCGQKAEP